MARAESAGSNASIQRARHHFLVGKEAYGDKDYATALREFEEGYLIEPRAGFLLDMGHAARRLGDLRHALQLYQRFLATDPPETDRRVVVKLVADLRRELPSEGASFAASSAATPPPRGGTLSLAAPASSSSSSAGSPSSLTLVDVALPSDAAASDPEVAGSPFYRRWWFWAGAGSVAAGVVTAILIGTLGSGSSARDSGTWGQIKL